MTRVLVMAELYLPVPRQRELEARAAAIRGARLVRLVHVSADEMCVLFLETESEADARGALDAVGIVYDRVVQAREARRS